MADWDTRQDNIRVVRPEPEEDLYSEGPDDEELLTARRDRIRRIRGIAVIVIVLLLLGTVLGVFLFRKFFRYQEIRTTWEKELSQGSLVGFARYDGGILKYSKDGVTCFSGRGDELWVDTYEMKNPTISVNGPCAVIGDMQGNELRIYGSGGKTGEANTLLPLTKTAVSGTGVAAVIVEDASAAYITFFSKEGKPLDITIKSILSGDGYPVAMALSKDGTRLMTGYQYISGGTMRGRVVFYDFSEIGKNIPNRLVGGFDEPFRESLIGEVGYLDEINSYAVSTAGLAFFSSRNLAAPSLIKAFPETDEIEMVFHNKEYVCVVLRTPNAEYAYRIEVYRANGDAVFSKPFNGSYTSGSVDGKYVFLNSADRCLIFNMQGTEKYSGPSDFGAELMLLSRFPGEFVMVGPGGMRGVKLK